MSDINPCEYQQIMPPADVPQTPRLMPKGYLICPDAPVKKRVFILRTADDGDPARKVVRRLNFDLCQ